MTNEAVTIKTLTSKRSLESERFQQRPHPCHSLSKKIEEVDTRLSKKIDEVDARLSKKIEGAELNLSRKIDAVAADLAAHRADTEIHKARYQIREDTGS
ncbi:MAG: hypothetical protein FJ117_22765 [Deltaproteobacteria bacterium]|nr:hypothetical protein [Deltaproteobacteria bacterium]